MATLVTRGGIEIGIDEEDLGIIDEWAYVTVCQMRGRDGMVRYQYPMLFGERDASGHRRCAYLAREIVKPKDGEVVLYMDGNGLNCHKANLMTDRRRWRNRAERPV